MVIEAQEGLPTFWALFLRRYPDRDEGSKSSFKSIRGCCECMYSGFDESKPRVSEVMCLLFGGWKSVHREHGRKAIPEVP
jgi:hypothetical protein